MRTLVFLSLCLCLGLSSASADYVDPYGLPSGSRTMYLATQEAIVSGESIEAFDFANDEVIFAAYAEQVSAGLADLVFFELHPDSLFQYLRAPEGSDGFDRALIAQLGAVELEDVSNIEDVEFAVTLPAVNGDTYVILQIQLGELPEITAVKFRITVLDETQVSFDWVLQPSGSLYFEPSSIGDMNFGELKRHW
jgi:hypothetical protein